MLGKLDQLAQPCATQVLATVAVVNRPSEIQATHFGSVDVYPRTFAAVYSHIL